MTIEETFNLLIAKVQDNITTNGQGDITGKKNRDTLIEMLQGIQSVLDAPDDYLLNQFPPYDPTFLYQGGKEVVVQYVGRLWAFVSSFDKQGFTPGNDVSVWAMISALSIAHFRNRDTMLDEDGPGQVTALEIRQFIDNFEEGEVELHTYRYKVVTNGEQNFIVPAREIVIFQINGVTYAPATYTLGVVTGNTRILKWEGIDDFVLDVGDEISVMYNGTEVII